MSHAGKKSKTPQYWYPLEGDKNRFGKKYVSDMRKTIDMIREKYKRKLWVKQ